MPNPSPPPPPPPPPPSPPLTPTRTPSKKRLLTNPKPKQSPHQSSPSNHLPKNDKKTRDLPNLSDCHSCGIRINYTNPKDRLQMLDSFWRIVLLCKKCIKQVNSGQSCLYCFNDTANSVSDCFNCRDCERLIHKDCVSKYGNSTPWSYSCKELGLGLDLGFSVCIDCWVPELLKSSIKNCSKKKKNEKDDDNGDRSLEDMVKDVNWAVEKKLRVAVKAKEKALRKAVVAQNTVELASNALELAVTKDHNGKAMSGGLVRSCSDKGNGVNDVTRVVDDAELAFRLHRAMNSSPRISKNTCSVNLSCLDLLKKTGSNGISPKWMDVGSHEGGNVGLCSKRKFNQNHNRSISEASAHIEAEESGSAVVKTYKRKRKECLENGDVCEAVTSLSVAGTSIINYESVIASEPVVKTYKRKRKECLENGDVGDVVTSFSIVGTSISNDDSRIVSESQSCQQDEYKLELHVNNAWASCPEQCNVDITQKEGSGNAKPDKFLLKYSKRTTGSFRGLHHEASSCYVAFQKENQASAPALPAYCSTECSGLSDASMHSCVVNLQGCASVVGSSQVGG